MDLRELRDRAMLAALPAIVASALSPGGLLKAREVVALAWAIADEAMLQRARTLEENGTALTLVPPLHTPACVNGYRTHLWLSRDSCQRCGAVAGPDMARRRRAAAKQQRSRDARRLAVSA